MKRDVQFTQSLNRLRDPTGELLLDWQTETGSTIGVLIKYFLLLERYDILKDPQFKSLISELAYSIFS